MSNRQQPIANSQHTNALIHETSPYLLQHAHNPVNWQPWGEAAFAQARAEEKPIFLSVGYSACHWCHVMERESFENAELAAILNAHFVAIKVDREERPDVDEIYMAAVQAQSGRGGWPMSVFLTPEGKPFFGGTYFPPAQFAKLLQHVALAWRDQRGEILQDAESLSDAVRQYLAARKPDAAGQLDETLLDAAVAELEQNFDPRFGGFGQAPKFPPNNGLPLLLCLAQRGSSPLPPLGGGAGGEGPQSKQTPLSPNPSPRRGEGNRIRTMLALTLDRMALGGIHDQLGGGFHRYSTDEHWLVPHFEKMLYDNALLARSFAEASAVYALVERASSPVRAGEDARPTTAYAAVARDTYDWVLREMTSAEGGFYSSLDADSEGVEGKFYVWPKAEIDAALGADAAQFCALFNVTAAGNYHEEASGEATGRNILHLSEPIPAELQAQADAWKATLLAIRAKRIGPGRDDKILTAWNGLMIASLARGAVLLHEPRYLAAAARAAEFALAHLRTAEGRWLATYGQGRAKLPAYLDDHAFMAVAFLELFDATHDTRWENEAIAIVKLLDAHFAAENGGYFFTADDHEKLLARTQDPVDKAIPSGNGWAAQALVRLWLLTGDTAYRDKAARLFREFQGLMERAPQATESLLWALAQYLDAERSAGILPVKEYESKLTLGAVAAELSIASHTGSQQQGCPCHTLSRGAQTALAVRLAIKPGFHVTAQATRIALLPGGPFKLSAETYPPAETLGELKVYSGDVTIGATVAVPADAPLGTHFLKVRLHFQACDDRQCEAPAAVTLATRIDVTDK